MRSLESRSRLRLHRFGCKCFVLLWSAVALQAEVKYDGSMGTSVTGSAIVGGKTDYQIQEADGQLRGSNLFHSFIKFDLTSSESATFFGNAGIRNILARVTSGSASSIDGKISSQIAGANLFLMNPSGLIFGPNASVDVSGSFFATTADYIKLGNDGKFAATNPGDSVLSVSDPSAFGFLTPNPAAIRVNGSKFVEGSIKTLGFIGGDVSITGDAILLAEDVQLFSVNSVGEAKLQLPNGSNGLRWASINAEGFSKRGTVTIDGTPADPMAPTDPPFIQGQRVVIRGGTFVVKTGYVGASASTAGDGLYARTDGTMTVTDGSVLFSMSETDLRGHRTIDIAAGNALLDNESIISTGQFYDGAGGDLRLAIDGTLRLANFSHIVASSDSSIAGADLSVSAGDLTMEGASGIQVASLQTGTNGNLEVIARGHLSMSEGSLIDMRASGEPGAQPAGNLSVSANSATITGAGTGIALVDLTHGERTGTVSVRVKNQLAIQDGGGIVATTASKVGAEMSIEAGDLLVTGGQDPTIPSGIFSLNFDGGIGSVGSDIRIAVRGSAQVIDGGLIGANVEGLGTGGNIYLTATNLLVTGLNGQQARLLDPPRGIIAKNLSQFDPNSQSSGNIYLTLSGRLEVRDGGEIAADTRGPGAGGSVTITARDASVSTNGLISARTIGEKVGGQGGDVIMSVSGLLSVTDKGSISASTSGPGAGGQVHISGGEIEISGRGAQITATSGRPGKPATGAGGAIFVQADTLTLSNGGQVTATTYGAGSGGSVQVDADRLRISGSGSEGISGLVAQSLGGAGAGGSIRVAAEALEMSGKGAAISTLTLGSGNAGVIRIAADTVSMTADSGIQSSSAGTGVAGSIDISANSTITLRDGASITVAAPASNAGDIRLRAGESITLADAKITAEAGLDGGNIDLRAPDLISFTNSLVSAAAGYNGGNIFIDPFLVTLDSSTISANAIFGRGGNIRIISELFFASPDSLVTATSRLGIDGTVRIDALNNELRENLVELPSELIDADALLRELCAMKTAEFSSLVSEGRGGLPPLPGEAIPSLTILP